VGNFLYPAVTLFVFSYCIDKHTAIKILTIEPDSHQIEQGQDTLDRRTFNCRKISIEPAKPYICFCLKYSPEQILLRTVIRIETAPRYPGFFDDSGNPCRMNTYATEQTACCLQYFALYRNFF